MNYPEEQVQLKNPSENSGQKKSKLLHILMQKAMQKGTQAPTNGERLWPGDN